MCDMVSNSSGRKVLHKLYKLQLCASQFFVQNKVDFFLVLVMTDQWSPTFSSVLEEVDDRPYGLFLTILAVRPPNAIRHSSKSTKNLKKNVRTLTGFFINNPPIHDSSQNTILQNCGLYPRDQLTGLISCIYIIRFYSFGARDLILPSFAVRFTSGFIF